MNIVETIAKSLGYSDIQKIDPNTQKVTDGAASHGTNSLGQATIPTVLPRSSRLGRRRHVRAC